VRIDETHMMNSKHILKARTHMVESMCKYFD